MSAADDVRELGVKDRLARRWVNYCAALIEAQPPLATELRTGVARLTEAVNREWPPPEDAECFGISDLGDALAGLTHRTRMEFLVLTTDILMSGVDGPHRTSEYLTQTIDHIEERAQ